MKSALMFAAAVVALSAPTFAAAPALADNGQVFDYAAQSRAFPAGEPVQNRQCFNGKMITGVNRAGAGNLYVQSRQGGVYDLKLAGACAALDDAVKISVRSGGTDAVCNTGRAEVVIDTAAGPMRCAVSEVRKVTAREGALLAARR